MLYGVDIHAQYQAGINLATLKAQGYTFVVTKASEGRSVPNTSSLSAAGFKARYLSWIGQARTLGMVPGLYHWLKAGNATAQAQFFHSLVVEAGGPKGLLIQLDCEDNATYADVTAWAAEWHRLTGGHPFLLYTGGWWWRPKGWDGLAVTPYLWESHYLTADSDTAQDDPAAFAARVPSSWWTPGYGKWSVATILQFTSRGDAGSLGNNVDLNAFRGSLDDLARLTGAQPNGDNDMFCAHGETASPRVRYLQRRIVRAGGDLSDVGGVDGSYGNGTARELAKLAGGDGRVYDDAAADALDEILRARTAQAVGVKGDPGAPGMTPTEVTITGPIVCTVTAVK